MAFYLFFLKKERENRRCRAWHSAFREELCPHSTMGTWGPFLLLPHPLSSQRPGSLTAVSFPALDAGPCGRRV